MTGKELLTGKKLLLWRRGYREGSDLAWRTYPNHGLPLPMANTEVERKAFVEGY